METSVSQAELLRTHFAQQGGYLTSSQVRSLGIDLKVVSRMIGSGEVEQVQRGVYRFTEAELPEHADLIELQLRVPTLITALNLYGLTTARSTQIRVTIPANCTMPDMAYPPVTSRGLLVSISGLCGRHHHSRASSRHFHHPLPRKDPGRPSVNVQ